MADEIEVLEELVEELAEPLMDEISNERAAESSSYIHEGYEDDFDGIVWIKAKYGDVVAVNGEIVDNQKPHKPPRGWVVLVQGSQDPFGEDVEIELESFIPYLTDVIEKKSGHRYNEKDVLEVFSRKHKPRLGDYVMWTSYRGLVEIWTTKTALKEYERRKEEHARAAREKRDREAQEARERANEERRQKVKRGGFPKPKDWSPTGELEEEP